MTPQQVTAELSAILAEIDGTFDRDGDRQYRLEQTQDRLTELVSQLRASAGAPAAAFSPGDLADTLTVLRDGPHADEHTAAAAGLASEAVRFLNYATGPHAGQGVTYPATVYAVTGALAEAASRLPQAFGQMSGWLDRELAAGRLAEDHGRPVAPLAGRARLHLDEAARHASDLAIALLAAQAAVATVHQAGGGAA